MVRPLDHVTVIQQINFAERIHQNQQTHPEISYGYKIFTESFI